MTVRCPVGRPAKWWDRKTPEQRLRILKSNVRTARQALSVALDEGSDAKVADARGALAVVQRNLDTEEEAQRLAREAAQAKRTARTRERRERRKRAEARAGGTP